VKEGDNFEGQTYRYDNGDRDDDDDDDYGNNNNNNNNSYGT
jgi:hypothetical protein